jgi:hypothetical protein
MNKPMTERVELRPIEKGCVVLMKRSSGLVGYGNPQCVSEVIEGLGEISLYGHNQLYKTYDVEKILEYPPQAAAAMKPPVSPSCALRDALETFKASVIYHLIERAKYFERTTGAYSRKETANSYRQTAKEIERMTTATDLKPMPAHLGDAAYALAQAPVEPTAEA